MKSLMTLCQTKLRAKNKIRFCECENPQHHTQEAARQCLQKSPAISNNTKPFHTVLWVELHSDWTTVPVHQISYTSLISSRILSSNCVCCGPVTWCRVNHSEAGTQAKKSPDSVPPRIKLTHRICCHIISKVFGQNKLCTLVLCWHHSMEHGWPWTRIWNMEHTINTWCINTWNNSSWVVSICSRCARASPAIQQYFYWLYNFGNNSCPPFHSQEWAISNFACSLSRTIPSHGMKNMAFHSLLRWKMVMLQILTMYLIHFSLTLSVPRLKSAFSQTFKRETYKWCSENW